MCGRAPICYHFSLLLAAERGREFRPTRIAQQPHLEQESCVCGISNALASDKELDLMERCEDGRVLPVGRERRVRVVFEVCMLTFSNKG
jgi:hypothetical protein